MNSKVKKIGKYEIVGILGEGAMGVVYKGLDPIIERYVAIKTIRHDVPELEGHDIRARFIREAQAAGRLHHPNIVGVYEYNQDADRDYIVMEFVQGVSLAEYVGKHGRLGIKEACDIMVKVLEALDFAHSKGVVHRDIKPGNIMLSDSGEVKVADFGIARIESSTLTKVGTVVGTPAYMSPEQLLGQSVDQRSDIFSAGTLLYKLLTGEKPFTGPNVTAVIYRIVHNEHTHPSKLEPELAKEFDDILARALAKRPEERFQAAEEFAATLARAAEKISIADEHSVARDGKTAPVAEPSQSAVEHGWLDNAAREPTAPSKPIPQVAEAQGEDSVKAPRTPDRKKSFLILGVVTVSVLAMAAFWFLTKEHEFGLKLAGHEPPRPDQRIVPPAKTRPDTPEPALSPPLPARQPGEQVSTSSSQGPGEPPLADVEPLAAATFVALAEGDLRQGPSTEAARLDTFSRGTRLEVIGKVREKDWYRVKVGSGATGYAQGALLRRTRTRDSVSPGETFKDCPSCPDLVVVPAGTFHQGSPPTESEREDNEGPRRYVHIGYPMAVSRYEVTRAEFAQFVAQTGYQANGCWVYDGQWTEVDSLNWQNPGFAQDDDHPVTCVSWSDAQAYVQWLSDETLETYRLLSASEWEYMARARREGARPWEDLEAACDSANVADLASEQRYNGWQVHGCWDDYVHTAPVGSFKPNDYGIYDTLGNVFEWVQDCWNSNYLWAPSDGSPWLEGDCEHRVLRGGSWFSMPRYVRLAFRNRYNADYRGSSFGFRVARVLGQ